MSRKRAWVQPQSSTAFTGTVRVAHAAPPRELLTRSVTLGDSHRSPGPPTSKGRGWSVLFSQHTGPPSVVPPWLGPGPVCPPPRRFAPNSAPDKRQGRTGGAELREAVAACGNGAALRRPRSLRRGLVSFPAATRKEGPTRGTRGPPSGTAPALNHKSRKPPHLHKSTLSHRQAKTPEAPPSPRPHPCARRPLPVQRRAALSIARPEPAASGGSHRHRH
jgi:hypothetical protein